MPGKKPRNRHESTGRARRAPPPSPPARHAFRSRPENPRSRPSAFARAMPEARAFPLAPCPTRKNAAFSSGFSGVRRPAPGRTRRPAPDHTRHPAPGTPASGARHPAAPGARPHPAPGTAPGTRLRPVAFPGHTKTGPTPCGAGPATAQAPQAGCASLIRTFGTSDGAISRTRTPTRPACRTPRAGTRRRRARPPRPRRPTRASPAPSSCSRTCP